MEGVLLRRMRALGYERAQSFLLTNMDEMHVALVWMEEQRIRLYPPEERGDMRDRGKFEASLVRYLKDLKSPHALWSGGLSTQNDFFLAFEWLTSYAIQCDFRDRSDAHNAKCAAILREEDERDTLLSSQYHSPEFTAHLRDACQLIGLEISDYNNTPSVLKALAFDISTRFSDTALKIVAHYEDLVARKQAADLSLDALHLGFSTGNAKVDCVAKVLRFLHVITLRQLQDIINEMISEGQMYTANPLTDSKLGKVGF